MTTHLIPITKLLFIQIKRVEKKYAFNPRKRSTNGLILNGRQMFASSIMSTLEIKDYFYTTLKKKYLSYNNHVTRLFRVYSET